VEQLDFQVGISDEMIAVARGFEGMSLRVEPWNHEASLDTIRHYSHGIGDMNPLWADEAYASSSEYGDVLAPPTFLYSVFDGAIGLGFEGVQPIYAGTSWTFHKRLRRGDRYRPEATMGPVTIHEGRAASKFAIQTVVTRYWRVRDDVCVAEAKARTFRVPRSGVGGGLSYKPREVAVFRDDELVEISEAARNAPRRGDKRRTAQEVSVGEQIPAVVKGPLNQITMTAYYAGCIGSPGYKADELSWWYRYWAVNEPERLPNNYDPTYYSERVLPSLGHQNADVARQIGMPGAYGNGPQKCGWMAHPVTNWMGDEGFLADLDVKLRAPDVFGDVTRCYGTVTGVDTETGRVSIDLESTNHLGDITATGSATVVLPTN
jgi:hypothetical protein